jgi:AraC-like DNA-binding protein
MIDLRQSFCGYCILPLPARPQGGGLGNKCWTRLPVGSEVTRVRQARVEGYHRLGIFAEVPRLVQELGADPVAVAIGAGIDPSVFRSTETSISYLAAGRLMQTSVERTRCSHFGLLLGERANLSHFGIVGQLIRAAPNLGRAIADLVDHHHRHVSGATTYLLVQHDWAFWGYASYLPGVPAIDQICDTAMSVGLTIIRELSSLSPEDVLFSHSAPADFAPYRKVFGMLPRFNAEQSALVFPARLLTHRLPGADPRSRRDLEEAVASHFSPTDAGVAPQVIRALRPRVVLGGANLDEVARVMALTPRTLNRRLRAEGTTFRKVLNEVRFEVARQFLEGTRMSITEIAFALSYADASSFDHAFQRMSGVTPTTWRAGAQVTRRTDGASRRRRTPADERAIG